MPRSNTRSKNKVVAEYQLLESLPAELQTSLPSIEQIERELEGGDTFMKDGSQ